jgi:type IV secretory pathway protease TraF
MILGRLLCSAQPSSTGDLYSIRRLYPEIMIGRLLLFYKPSELFFRRNTRGILLDVRTRVLMGYALRKHIFR